jgi:hypothetical protein
MGVREQLRDHPRVAAVVATLLVIAGGSLLYLQVAGGTVVSGPPRKLFVTVDDGKTFFVAPAEQLPPFQHEGKTALRAYVFTCGGAPFVGYLERYSDRAKALMLEGWKAQRESGAPPSMNPEMLNGIEVKRPGETTWVRHSELARAAAIMNVRCPNQQDKAAEMVLP